MATQKIKIKTQDGTEVEAMAPFVVSASRSTDIPAFYGKWFMQRLGNKKDGYVVWYNPFNRQPIYVSFVNTKIIVFWTKNPKPFLGYLDDLDNLGFHYYFQYTVNNYEEEGFEPNIPSLQKRIETFQSLSKKVGPERVIWRFDPIIFTPTLTPRVIATRIFEISKQLKGFTNKLVFSFIDVDAYRKVQNNLLKNPKLSCQYTKETISHVQGSMEQIEEFCDYLQKMRMHWLEKGWDLTLATCAEKVDLDRYGIEHNKCVDDVLMYQAFGDDPLVADFLNIQKQSNLPFLNLSQMSLDADLFPEEKKQKIIPIVTSLKKDKGQRKECGCVESKDIGSYNTCANGCIYCYANTSEKEAKKNLKRHHEFFKRYNKYPESIVVPAEMVSE